MVLQEGKEDADLSITSDLIRGHTDTIILAALLEGDNYGYKINRMIFEASLGRYELKEATLYTAFKRLETLKYISSYWGDEDHGARRRYYKITPLGRREYAKLLAEWHETRELIDRLLCGKDITNKESRSI